MGCDGGTCDVRKRIIIPNKMQEFCEGFFSLFFLIGSTYDQLHRPKNKSASVNLDVIFQDLLYFLIKVTFFCYFVSDVKKMGQPLQNFILPVLQPFIHMQHNF